MNRTKKVSHLYAELYNRPDHQRRVKMREVRFNRKPARMNRDAQVQSMLTPKLHTPPKPQPSKKQGFFRRIFRRQAR